MVVKKDEPTGDQNRERNADASPGELELDKATVQDLADERLDSVEGGLARREAACIRTTSVI